MGAFDDLIPQKAEPVKAGVFDDLIPKKSGAGRTAARLAGQGAIGFNDVAAGFFGAPVDATSWALRKIGVPVGNEPVGGSESLKKGIDYVATLPGRINEFTDILNPKPGTLTDERTSRFEPENQAEKIARGTGEGIGNALSIAVPAARFASALKPGVGQGVAETLASQPAMQTVAGAVGGATTAATDNPWLGAAAGAAVPIGASVVRRAISPVKNALAPQEQNLVDAALRENISLTPAQITGSPTLKTIEGTMASLPLASGPMQSVLRKQRGDFNEAVMSRTGATARDASPDTIEAVKANLGKTFDDLESRTTLDLSGKNGVSFARDVDKAATEYGKFLPLDQAPIFEQYIKTIGPLIQAIQTPGANPQITGEIYKNIRSGLATRIRETQNGDLKRALGGLAEAFDNAMENSATGALRKEWQDVRRQWSALATVDKAMQGGTQTDRSAANIPFSSLRTAVLQGDRSGYSQGRGQLNELSRVGDYLANKVPDSGTIPRGFVANALTGGALFGGGVASGVGIPAAVVGAASPYLVSKFYNSPAGKAWLTNQLAGQTNFGAAYGSQAARELTRRNALSPSSEQ